MMESTTAHSTKFGCHLTWYSNFKMFAIQEYFDHFIAYGYFKMQLHNSTKSLIVMVATTTNYLEIVMVRLSAQVIEVDSIAIKMLIFVEPS